MTSSAIEQQETSPIAACTISRDVQNFDLLIEDMEAALGENWGDLGFTEAMAFLNQPGSNGMEFVAIAVDDHRRRRHRHAGRSDHTGQVEAKSR